MIEGVDDIAMPPTHEEYTVGWICALPRELAAAQGMLDEEHDSLPQDPVDSNQYTLGRIGSHNVVIACLPSGKLGVIPTAMIVAHMLSTFRRIQFGLLVGVGGGIPSSKHDIRLGDVVVGDLGVIQYDMGKTVQGGRFVSTQAPRRPSQVVLLAVSKLQARNRLAKQRMMEYVDQMTTRHPDFSHPGVHCDILYHWGYDHPEGADGDSCATCEVGQRVTRKVRASSHPVVHYGLIGSANQVMRHGGTREQLRKQHGILCFEMEAAGAMDMLPCLVIRGICDYSDSHKNKQWQDYAAVVGAAYAKDLLGVMQGLTFINPPVTVQRAASFMVPFQQTSRFVGREDILAMIERRLEAKCPVVLAGIGGVGKTQLAVRYCFKFRQKNSAADIFWVNASSAANFEQGYREIARSLCIQGGDDPDFELCSELCHRLSDPDAGPWLMVLDNLDDGQGLAAQMKFIPSPRRACGSIIVTTRDMRISQHLLDWDYMAGDPIAVPPLAPEEARNLFESALRPDLRGNQDDLQEVLGLLGYFPLALTQAIAFIKHKQTTVTKYKELLLQTNQAVTDQLRDTEYRDVYRYDDSRHSVYRTWKISFQQIRTQEAEAAGLLAWMSMFDAPAGVPEWLLCREGWNDLDLITVLSTLKSFSLVNTGHEGSLIMHPMIQKAVHSFLDQHHENERYQHEALTFLANKFPDPKTKCGMVYDELAPHAEEALRYRFKNARSSEPTILYRATLMHKVAAYHYQRGRYKLAYSQAQEAFTIRQSKLGDASLETLASLELVALVLVNQGEFKAAEETQRAVLNKRQALSERDESLIRESMKHLADVLLKLGRLDEAAKAYEEALEASIESAGERDRNSLELMDRLGEVLELQKRFPEAEKQYRKALVGKEATLRGDHPSTVQTRVFLNAMLARRSGWEKAHELYREALEMNTKSLGEKHPETVRLLCNIASLHAAQENWAEAEEVQLQAHRTFTEILGENHPSTLICQSNLAVFKQTQHQYTEAEQLHRSLWDRRNTVLGAQHPHTLASMYHLAEVLLELEKRDEARDLLETVLSGREEMLGRTHPDTLRCMSTLAGAFDELERFEDAERLYRECLDLMAAVLGPHHPHILVDMNNLAEVLRQQNKFSEAETLHRRVLQLHPEGTGYSFLITSTTNLARVLHHQGKYNEAIDLYQQAFQLIAEMSGDQSSLAKIVSDRLEVVIRERRESVWNVLSSWFRWVF